LKFWNYWDKLTAENKLFKNIFIILTALIIFLSISLVQVSKKQRIIVLPPRVDKEFWVSEKEVSNTYLEQIGTYIAELTMNVSPKNVDLNFDKVIPFASTDPQITEELKKELLNQANAIKKDYIYQSFYIDGVSVIESKNGKYVLVEGLLRRSTGDIYIGSRNANIKIFFDVKAGRFYITKLEVNNGFITD
jgi:conjugal transfer pilus assembly protein TraE